MPSRCRRVDFPAPGWAHDGDKLAFFDVDVDTPEHVSLAWAMLEEFFNVA